MDAAIVFSSDKDLMPAIETVYDLDLCHIEVACWQGAHRLRFGGTQLPWCHNLSAADFASIEDPIDYAAR